MSNEPKKEDIYKDTVFLPKTEFPMRGDLAKKEPDILKRWQDMDLYGQLREQSKAQKKWVLHDGPPYANGHIHIGHAMNKILKDVVVRSYQMKGYNAPYVPGWDCHGLPIEWKIEEKYREEGKDKDDVDVIDFRAECRDFAKKWVDIQSAEFQRLGVSGDWDTPYLTMLNEAEGKIVREIHKFAQNGLLYRGAKPIMWSVVEQTALAEAEIEYRDHKSVTIWIKFPVRQTKIEALKDAHIVIWTTTPWTMPSNRALAYGENIEYGVFEVKSVAEGSRAIVGDKLALAVSLADDVKNKAKIDEWEQVATFKGSELEGTICHHPLHGKGYDFDVPMLYGNFVTEEAGTGFVHIAPGHGEDDFNLVDMRNKLMDVKDAGAIKDDEINYLRYNLAYPYKTEITDNVTDNGKFRDHVPLFGGMEVYTQDGELGGGNFAVLKEMAEVGALLAKGSMRHEYPHSWRSKAPLIFRTTPQWFVGMDDKSDLRDRALKSIKETRWVPEKGQARISAMIENRPDWCISRQRSWGVPIALFVHKETSEVLKDESVLTRIGDIFEKEGADSWWSRPARDFLGADYNADDYEQIFDIVDVWFESGSTHAFVLGDTERWPVFEGVKQADLYLEGSDQHRGWFQSSLLESCGTKGKAPYKTVLTHGFVLDKAGYKMSKSAGNVVSPLDIMDKSGADILRLWTLMSNYTEDIRISDEALKSTSDIYRRIRNTLRFLLGALEGFTVAEKVPLDEHAAMPELERLMLHRLYEMDSKVQNHIENFEFSKLTKLLHDFCNEDLSAFYFDIRKDRLYCDRPDLFERRACRTVLCHIFEALTAWLAPLLCFTAEEAWSHRPDVFGDVGSVHLRGFMDVPAEWGNEDYKNLFMKWSNIKQIRSVVNAAIEPLRASKELGSSLEANTIIYTDPHYKEYINDIDLKEICIVSNDKTNAEGVPDHVFTTQEFQGLIGVEIQKAEGSKCGRCWKVLPEVGSQMEGVCNRCADAVESRSKNEKAA